MSRNLSSRVTATHGSVRLHSSNEACDAMKILCYYKLNMKIKEKYRAGHTWRVKLGKNAQSCDSLVLA